MSNQRSDYMIHYLLFILTDIFVLQNAHMYLMVEHLGYTYLHGACSTGDIETVKQLICQGVDVNLDTYKFSPLFIAAQSRRENVVEVLLEHGANPNYQNLDQSTPLHALASLRVCDCVASYCFCDRRRPVDKIVNMLINKGANIEARNCHGDTPLQSALLVFDSDLLRTLLEHGANVNNLNEDRMFRMDFTPFELKNYPITLNMIEAMKSLQSAGYSMNLHTALRMMKYWMRVRGNDIDYFTLCFDGTKFNFSNRVILMSLLINYVFIYRGI
uniref:Uncharacterized protein n=1 Tax=Trichogramma kaykai TaxID=54128 RepID=A0ABD2XMI3_9HYME